MNTKKFISFMDKATYLFEMIIALLLLVVIAIKTVEVVSEMAGFQITILDMDFARILSTMLTLIIGAEFIKMLCKHTPETIIDVLLFAIARQIVIYHEKTLDLLVGMVAIAGLFAAKRFLLEKSSK
ncbi:MAG: hypothetical protein FWB78_06420 [Treponema sp.]|nr:hypothetical protein [Treponema sp.]